MTPALLWLGISSRPYLKDPDTPRELGVGWNTVMRAVREHGWPLVDDPGRLAGVTGLGVDEHVWAHAGPGRSPRLLDVVPGRTGPVYANWLAGRSQVWRDTIAVAVLDPFRGYATVLPQAKGVLDAFLMVKLGLDAVDEVRRRVQQETTGHRGHRGDPLYETDDCSAEAASTSSAGHAPAPSPP